MLYTFKPYLLIPSNLFPSSLYTTPNLSSIPFSISLMVTSVDRFSLKVLTGLSSMHSLLYFQSGWEATCNLSLFKRRKFALMVPSLELILIISALGSSLDSPKMSSCQLSFWLVSGLIMLFTPIKTFLRPLKDMKLVNEGFTLLLTVPAFSLCKAIPKFPTPKHLTMQVQL